jgi:hypothetical protein
MECDDLALVSVQEAEMVSEDVHSPPGVATLAGIFEAHSLLELQPASRVMA